MIFNRVTLPFYSLPCADNKTLIAKGGGHPLYSMHEILDKIKDVPKASISMRCDNIYSISFYVSQLFYITYQRHFDTLSLSVIL